MERIYEVTIEYSYDYGRYFVRAADAMTAGSLALQADAASEVGKAEQASRDPQRRPRVSAVTELCDAAQFVV